MVRNRESRVRQLVALFRELDKELSGTTMSMPAVAIINSISELVEGMGEGDCGEGCQRDLHLFEVTVGQETGEKPDNRYLVICDHPIDQRVLQVAGLWLDNGVTGKQLREALPTAQAYVSVVPKYKEQWVTNAMKDEQKDGDVQA